LQLARHPKKVQTGSALSGVDQECEKGWMVKKAGESVPSSMVAVDAQDSVVNVIELVRSERFGVA
jgi:hypothetical protein